MIKFNSIMTKGESVLEGKSFLTYRTSKDNMHPKFLEFLEAYGKCIVKRGFLIYTKYTIIGDDEVEVSLYNTDTSTLKIGKEMCSIEGPGSLLDFMYDMMLGHGDMIIMTNDKHSLCLSKGEIR